MESGQTIGSLPLVSAWTEPALALITQLGDAWFVLTVLVFVGIIVGIRNRPVLGLTSDRVLTLAGLTLLGFALTETLKGLLMVPRPTGATTVSRTEWLPAVIRPLYTEFATATGYGFPSGHAVTGTVFYGGVAILSDWRTPLVRGGLAASIIATISTTRLLLNLHYLIDVFAGIGVGLVILCGYATMKSVWTPVAGFGIATIAAGVGILLVGPTVELLGTAMVCILGLVGLAVGRAISDLKFQ